MNDGELVRTDDGVLFTKSSTPAESWTTGPDRIVVGKDVLELISTSMYVDPMTIFREYVQNSADAIDETYTSTSTVFRGTGKVAIELDSALRSIKIRDNGAGLSWETFKTRICNLGASVKRGTAARGFRGVGRLAGLGYCQELIFRSRSLGEDKVSELRWDCRLLRERLRSSDLKVELSEIVREVVRARRAKADHYPEHFFEVELRGVIRHRDDRLLNPQAVGDYLSQVAPVPFAPEFRFGEDISAALRSYVALGDIEIRIDGLEKPVYRPHRNYIQIDDKTHDECADLEICEIPGINGGIAAVAWILHHGYIGAIPNKALVKGLRLRTGNMQVGDHAILEGLFPEPRFNAWSVGEVHVFESRVVPNGRRDHFEQNAHFDNLVNHLGPVARDIARRCRQSSIERKWLREFELQKTAAIEKAETVARGGLSKASRKTHTEATAKSLAAMQKIVNQRLLFEETRIKLASQTKSTVARVAKLLAGDPKLVDPLGHFRPQVRIAYEHVIGLIYECASNRVAAKALVGKILTKLEASRGRATKTKKSKR